MVLGGVAPPLRPPVFHHKFGYRYVANGGETVADVARRFGLEDTLPLCNAVYGYLPNTRLKAGDTIYLPFPRHRLKRLIERTQEVIESTNDGLEEVVHQQIENQEAFEVFLLKVEAASIFVNLFGGVAKGIMLARNGLKLSSSLARHVVQAQSTNTAKASDHVAKETAEEILHWLGEESYSTSRELLGMAIESSRAPKSALLLVLRHSPIGWVSLPYWASLVAALKDGQFRYFLYGPEGVTQKRVEELTRQTRRCLLQLNENIASMQYQLNSYGATGH
jgi:hypothetical protein